MKHKEVLIAQVLVVLGLGALWIVLEHRSEEEQRIASNQIKGLSNTVSSALSSLDELRAINSVLETNLAAHQAEYSNELAASQARREAAAAELAKVEAAAKTNAQSTAAAVARLDQQIADLEARHLNLDTQSADLHASITNLDAQIKDTKKKLAGATGDRELLTRELKQLQAKKAALERDFNDLATVRKQLRKVKAEIAAARQYDWVRRGVYASFNQKGGERLVHPVLVLPPNTNAVWNVELRHDGGAPVANADSTNAPLPR